MSGRLPRDPDSGWDEEKERRSEMTDIDVSKIKPGDVVGVRVLSIAATGAVEVRTEMDCAEWLHPSAIVSHTPAPKPALKVGDRVRCPFDTPAARAPFEVIWIEGAVVYFRPTKPGFSVAEAHLSEVETWERLS